MKKLAIIASLAAGLAVLPVANAGAVFHSPIYIGHASGNYATFANGSFHQALLSSDSQEYIGCYADSQPGFTGIACSARDATGHSAWCYDDSPSDAARQIVSAMGEYSYIYFSANSQGQCTEIFANNNTLYK
jgi:hypothetical protein